MRTPRLTEVFLITEVSAGNIIRMLGFPQWAAEELVRMDRKNAFAMAKVMKMIFAQWDMQDGAEKARSMQEVLTGKDNEFLHSMWADEADDEFGPGGNFNPYWKLFKQFPEFTKEVSSNAITKTSQLYDTREKYEERERESLTDTPEKVLDMDDGWSWVMIGSGECGIEGKRMQHCGKASGIMYSLRDPQGKPHVTMDVSPQPDGVDDGPLHIPAGDIIQLRGKQNDMPDMKYWAKIKSMVQKVGAEDLWDSYASDDDPEDERGLRLSRKFADFLEVKWAHDPERFPEEM